jgi:hypothetical protein
MMGDMRVLSSRDMLSFRSLAISRCDPIAIDKLKIAVAPGMSARCRGETKRKQRNRDCE